MGEWMLVLFLVGTSLINYLCMLSMKRSNARVSDEMADLELLILKHWDKIKELEEGR